MCWIYKTEKTRPSGGEPGGMGAGVEPIGAFESGPLGQAGIEPCRWPADRWAHPRSAGCGNDWACSEVFGGVPIGLTRAWARGRTGWSASRGAVEKIQGELWAACKERYGDGGTGLDSRAGPPGPPGEWIDPQQTSRQTRLQTRGQYQHEHPNATDNEFTKTGRNVRSPNAPPKC